MNRIPIALLLLGVCALAASERAGARRAQPESQEAARPLRGIERLYDGGAHGNAVFNARLRREIEAAGFAFVSDRAQAQAVIVSRGELMRDGGFRGELEFRSLSGGLLWHKSLVRPAPSRVMVYERLIRELRAAR